MNQQQQQQQPLIGKQFIGDRTQQVTDALGNQFRNLSNKAGDFVSDFPNKVQTYAKEGTTEVRDVIDSGLGRTRDAIVTMSPRLKKIALYTNIIAAAIGLHFVAGALLACWDDNLSKYRVVGWFMPFLFISVLSYVMNKNVGNVGAGQWSVIHRTGAFVVACLSFLTGLGGAVYCLKFLIDSGIVTAVRNGSYVYPPGAQNVTGMVGQYSPGVLQDPTYVLWILVAVLASVATVASFALGIMNIIIAGWTSVWNTAIAREMKLRSELEEYVAIQKGQASKGDFMSTVANFLIGVEGADEDVVKSHAGDHSKFKRHLKEHGIKPKKEKSKNKDYKV